MVELPNKGLRDPIALADWLELTALDSDDGNSSVGDLLSALQIPNDEVRPITYEDQPTDWDGDEWDDAPLEGVAHEVMLEIEHRKLAAGDGYPFRIEGATVLELQADWREYRPYVFCLCLSFLGADTGAAGGVDPYLLFEEVSCEAARNYVSGELFPFSSHCRRGKEAFRNAVDGLCAALREGGNYADPPRSAVRPKDGTVDLVVWKSFGDRMPSKFVMFGQCAGGENWKDKLAELRPRAFWDNWVDEPIVSPLINSFYVPHVVPRENWDNYARRVEGILFDRCRIAHWAHRPENSVAADDRYVDWCREALPGLS